MISNFVYRSRHGQFLDRPTSGKVNFQPTSFVHHDIFLLRNGRFHFHRDISRKEAHHIQNPQISLRLAAF